MQPLRLLETATQYTTTRNRYGDLVLTSLGTIKCLYRDISLLNRNVQSTEDVAIQGIFWFGPTSTLKKGNVIGYNDQLYRIEKVIVAKALVTNNQIQFIKCQVSLYRSLS